MTANERWIIVRDGQTYLHTELDGWSYMRARERGNPYQWEHPITVTRIVAAKPATTFTLRDGTVIPIQPRWRIYYRSGDTTYENYVEETEKEAESLRKELGV